MLPPPVPFSAPEPVLRELDRNESVLWVGQPNAEWMKKKAQPLALASIPLAAVVLGFIWVSSADMRAILAAGQSPDPYALFFPVLGLVALGVLGALAFSPWNEEYKARHTFYTLTNRRALIITGDKQKKVKSVLVSDFALERRDFESFGDVVLCRERIVNGNNESVIEVGFIGIEGAREVERSARELKSSIAGDGAEGLILP